MTVSLDCEENGHSRCIAVDLMIRASLLEVSVHCFWSFCVV